MSANGPSRRMGCRAPLLAAASAVADRPGGFLWPVAAAVAVLAAVAGLVVAAGPTTMVEVRAPQIEVAADGWVTLLGACWLLAAVALPFAAVALARQRAGLDGWGVRTAARRCGPCVLTCVCCAVLFPLLAWTWWAPALCALRGDSPLAALKKSARLARLGGVEAFGAGGAVLCACAIGMGAAQWAIADVAGWMVAAILVIVPVLVACGLAACAFVLRLLELDQASA